MRPVLGIALVALAACRKAPDELSAKSEAGAPGPVVTEAVAPPLADSGSDRIEAFCTDLFFADADRQRATCTASDASRVQSLLRIGANLCKRDLSAAVASRATFDHDAAASCTQMLREKPLARTSDTDTAFLHFPCDRVVLGTQAQGKPCRFSLECMDGLACVAGEDAGEPTCRPPGGLGQTCSDQSVGSTVNQAAAELHHPACGRGAWCDGRSCQARLGAGKACARSDACADGFACVMGRCDRKRAAGGPCRVSADCAFGLWCNEGAGTAGQCSEKLGEGAECAAADSCKGRCDTKRDSGGATDHAKCVSLCGSG